MTPDLVLIQAAQEGDRAIRTADEARAFVAEFEAAMGALMETIEEETSLVRAGRLFAATDVVTRKNAQLGHYLQIRTRLKNEFETISRLIPERLARMRDDHLAAIEKIRANLGVLAIAREVAEGIVRNVSASVGRQAAPRTYGRDAAALASSRFAARGIAVDRRS